MLSDCTDMIGGETALRQGNGEIIKVRGPGQVRVKFRPNSTGLTDMILGLRRRFAGQVYRASGSSCPRPDRTNHHGDLVPS